MKRVPRDRSDLERQLSEQLRFLERSAFAYDGGDPAEAKRLATGVRLLVHDTRVSKSLLGQLEIKDSLFFVDGGQVPNPHNLLTTAGLTGMHMKVGMGKESGAWWLPNFALPAPLRPRRLPFERWWTRPVIVDNERVEISRRDLILTMANQDGGAHVDPDLDATYARLQRQNSIGWHLTPSGAPVLGVEFASTRQIAWEVVETIKGRTDIGRNETCPCGSGKKYKRCHGRA